jgi:type IV pilus biogenesis protein CpaD/CtpE
MKKNAVPRAAGLLSVAAGLLAGCAYEPPKPGVHAGYGNPRAEVTCMFEAPTGSNFVVKRCRNTADMDLEGESARNMADGLKTPVPEIR